MRNSWEKGGLKKEALARTRLKLTILSSIIPILNTKERRERLHQDLSGQFLNPPNAKNYYSIDREKKASIFFDFLDFSQVCSQDAVFLGKKCAFRQEFVIMSENFRPIFPSFDSNNAVSVE